MTQDKLEDGGPAFPSRKDEPLPGGGGYRNDRPGMSLRDWFAGQALTGILAGGFAGTIPHDDANGGHDAAFFAYQYADAMLSARKGGSHE